MLRLYKMSWIWPDTLLDSSVVKKFHPRIASLLAANLSSMCSIQTCPPPASPWWCSLANPDLHSIFSVRCHNPWSFPFSVHPISVLDRWSRCCCFPSLRPQHRFLPPFSLFCLFSYILDLLGFWKKNPYCLLNLVFSHAHLCYYIYWFGDNYPKNQASW
jgi:hypothetical protein